MSFLENDPLKVFLSLDWYLVGGITFVIGWPAFALIDLATATVFGDKRIHPGWGTWIRWYSNFIGDTVFLTGTVVLVALFYQKADSGPGHAFAGGRFWIANVVMGAMVPIVFLALEEFMWKSYRGWADKLNIHRVYHSAYMGFIGYILVGGMLRSFGFWTYAGGEIQAFLGAVLFLGWLVTEYLDNKAPANCIWKGISERYPGRIVVKR